MLANGVDPSAAKRQTKLERACAAANTFEAIAKELVEKKRGEGKAGNTITKTEWLLGFAYPTIGARPIKEIGASDVLAVLRAVESRGRRET
ncbi:MAG TPA: integrase, partial [Roseiarcus sp.]|nr:integrase [Roseiarcus sp.]